jgi:hypothetical protein
MCVPVGMCKHMCVPVGVCVCVCVYACVCLWVCACICTYVWVRVYVCGRVGGGIRQYHTTISILSASSNKTKRSPSVTCSKCVAVPIGGSGITIRTDRRGTN